MLRTIIIEDEENIRNLIGMEVEESLQAEVIQSFSDTSGVLNFVESHSVDLIFLDLNLPRESGLELLKRLREVKQEIPVIIISGEASFENAQRGIELKTYAFLKKPYKRDKLHALIDEIYQKKLETASEIITLKNGSTTFQLHCNLILYIKADLNNVKIYTQDGTLFYATQPIKILETMLTYHNYLLRVDKSHIINMQQIFQIIPSKLEIQFKLEDQSIISIEVNKTGIDGIKKYFSK